MNNLLTSTLKNTQLIPKSFLKLPFEKIKADILGKKYDLSIVLVGKSKIKSLNTKFRQIDKPTDVLSFELSSDCGEIFICPEIAQKKAVKFLDPVSPKKGTKTQNDKISYDNYLLFLVIHACLHLKGMDHGSKMDKYEFAHYSRYRYRHL